MNTQMRAKRGRLQNVIDTPVSAEFRSTGDDASKWGMVKVTKFACKLCGQLFTQESNFFRHQRTAHGREKKTRGGHRPVGPS